MDTSVNAANQVVSVGADIALDADHKFFACLVRFESSSVFFFQAEDGIRDDLVTGVQTCALPIYRGLSANENARALISMMARSKCSNQRPDTLMQDRSPPARRNHLQRTAGPYIRVKTGGRDGAIRFPVYPRQPTCRQSAPTSVQCRFCCKSLFEVTNENFQGR